MTNTRPTSKSSRSEIIDWLSRVPASIGLRGYAAYEDSESKLYVVRDDETYEHYFETWQEAHGFIVKCFYGNG